MFSRSLSYGIIAAIAERYAKQEQVDGGFLMSARDEAFPCVTRLKEVIHYLGKSVDDVATDLVVNG